MAASWSRSARASCASGSAKRACNPSMSEIYFVRHGDTKLNIQGRIRGNANVPLTPESVKEIRKVAQERAKGDPKPSLICADGMKRARQSAEILAGNLRIKVHVMSGLRAWNLG